MRLKDLFEHFPHLDADLSHGRLLVTWHALELNRGEFLIGSHSAFRDITDRHAIIRLVLVFAIVDWPDAHLDAFNRRYHWGELKSTYCQVFF